MPDPLASLAEQGGRTGSSNGQPVSPAAPELRFHPRHAFRVTVIARGVGAEQWDSRPAPHAAASHRPTWAKALCGVRACREQRPTTRGKMRASLAVARPPGRPSLNAVAGERPPQPGVSVAHEVWSCARR